MVGCEGGKSRCNWFIKGQIRNTLRSQVRSRRTDLSSKMPFSRKEICKCSSHIPNLRTIHCINPSSMSYVCPSESIYKYPYHLNGDDAQRNGKRPLRWWLCMSLRRHIFKRNSHSGLKIMAFYRCYLIQIQAPPPSTHTHTNVYFNRVLWLSGWQVSL